MDNIAEFIYLAIAIVVVAIPLLYVLHVPLGIALAVLVTLVTLLLQFCDHVTLFFKERREKKELDEWRRKRQQAIWHKMLKKDGGAEKKGEA